MWIKYHPPLRAIVPSSESLAAGPLSAETTTDAPRARAYFRLVALS
jgi:hypothetical protein